MSSYLFSATCNDPLQGTLDFTIAAKPFRSKIIEAGISIVFNEQPLNVRLVETFTLLVSQQINLHRGNCVTLPTPCWDDGFEVDPFEDSFGFEPTRRVDVLGNVIGATVDCDTVTAVVCGSGFEDAGYSQQLLEDSDPECTSTCGEILYGPCTTTKGTVPSIEFLPSLNNTKGDGYIVGARMYVWNSVAWIDNGLASEYMCTDRSPTTLATSFTETLMIEDMTDDFVVLNMVGAIAKSIVVSYVTENQPATAPVTAPDGRGILS